MFISGDEIGSVGFIQARNAVDNALNVGVLKGNDELKRKIVARRMTLSGPLTSDAVNRIESNHFYVKPAKRPVPDLIRINRLKKNTAATMILKRAEEPLEEMLSIDDFAILRYDGSDSE